MASIKVIRNQSSYICPGKELLIDELKEPERYTSSSKMVRCQNLVFYVYCHTHSDGLEFPAVVSLPNEGLCGVLALNMMDDTGRFCVWITWAMGIALAHRQNRHFSSQKFMGKYSTEHF